MKQIRKSNLGFSLVELMVVVSIITLLGSITFPSYVKFMIRAARVEMTTNLRHIATLAHAYHAENSQFPGIILYGVSNGTTNCGPNALGFSVGDCMSLRYEYLFRGGWQVNASTYHFTRETYFGAYARALYIDGDYDFSTGRGPPTKHCIVPEVYSETNGGYFYYDAWTLNENGEFKAVFDGDAEQNCLSGASVPIGG